MTAASTDAKNLATLLGSPLRLLVVERLLEAPWDGWVTVAELSRDTACIDEDVRGCLAAVEEAGIVLRKGSPNEAAWRLAPQHRRVAERAVRETALPVARVRDRMRAAHDAWFGHIIGVGPRMKLVFEQAKLAARSDVPVLILGESGTGKELVARAIHEIGPLADGPLVTVNVAAIPATLFESELFGYEQGAFTGANRRRIGRIVAADGGTLFLDEIAELSTFCQSLDRAALDLLRAHRWPGNVRELESVVYRAALFSRGEPIGRSTISEALVVPQRDTPSAVRRLAAVESQPPTGTLEEVIRVAVLAALERHQGNVTAAARELDISKVTLYRRLRDYEAKAPGLLDRLREGGRGDGGA